MTDEQLIADALAREPTWDAYLAGPWTDYALYVSEAAIVVWWPDAAYAPARPLVFRPPRAQSVWDDLVGFHRRYMQ